MKIIYLPGFHHNSFVATHALGHMINGKIVFVKTYTLRPSYFCEILVSPNTKERSRFRSMLQMNHYS